MRSGVGGLAREELLQRFARIAALGDVPADRNQHGDRPASPLDHGVLLVVSGGIDVPLQVLSGFLHASRHDLRTLFHMGSLQRHVRYA